MHTLSHALSMQAACTMSCTTPRISQPRTRTLTSTTTTKMVRVLTLLLQLHCIVTMPVASMSVTAHELAFLLCIPPYLHVPPPCSASTEEEPGSYLDAARKETIKEKLEDAEELKVWW